MLMQWLRQFAVQILVVAPPCQWPLITCIALEVKIQYPSAVTMEMEYLAVRLMRLQEYAVEVECLLSFYQKLFHELCDFYITAPCLSDNQVDLVVLYGSPSNITSGIVRVCSNGSGGLVCDSGWDHADARVACKAAGYSPYGDVNLTVTANSALIFSLIRPTSRCRRSTKPVFVIIIIFIPSCHE